MQIIHARAYTHEAQVGEYCALPCSACTSLSRSYQHISPCCALLLHLW